MSPGSPNERFEALRERATRAFEQGQFDGDSADTQTHTDLATLLQELQVHQIELEMQNEELQAAYAELERSRDNFSNLYDFAPVGYLTLAKSGIIVEANLTSAGMLGFSRGELTRRSLIRSVAEADHERYFRWLQAVQENEGIETGELLMVRNDGETFRARVDGQRVLCPSGDDPQIRVTISDVSELYRAREELTRMQRLESVGVLAGGIAHDFNNILTGILGNIALARMGMAKSDERFQPLRDCEHACERAQALTQQLLTFARGGAPVTNAVDLAGLVRRTVAFALRGSGVRQDFSFAADLMGCEVDEGQIGQVLENLIINARQAMNDAGTIYLSAENHKVGYGAQLPLPPGHYVRCSIRDTGPGIAAEEQSHVFEPYYTTKPTGSGLGLAVSYSIVHKHGGHIDLRSTKGRGAEFIVYLPATGKPVSVSEEANAVREPTPGTGRILVMDDEEIVRNIASRMLKRSGYDVTAVPEGDAALREYIAAETAGTKYDLVILDLTVSGGMGGREAAAALRKHDPDARIIVSSGYANAPVMANFKEYGFDGVIRKPYTLQQLSNAVARWLESPADA